MNGLSCWCSRLLARVAGRTVAVPLATLLALVHPVIHGTPFDMGALDQFIVAVNAWAVMASE